MQKDHNAWDRKERKTGLSLLIQLPTSPTLQPCLILAIRGKDSPEFIFLIMCELWEWYIIFEFVEKKNRC